MISNLAEYFSQHIYLLLLLNAALSLIFGAAVFFVGERRGNRSLGVTGLIISALVGMILSWALALIVSVVFISLILIKGSSTKTSGDPDSNESTL